MIEIVLEMHWSNNPIPLNELVSEPDFIFDIPLGLFTSIDSSASVIGLLQPQIDDLSENKLDKIDYVQHFRGVFSSYVALTSALPEAFDGDYAHIDSGSGFDRMAAIWDFSDSKWVINAANVGSNTDEIPEGSTNLYFKSERVRATTLNGLDTSNILPVSPTDNIVQAIGKLAAMIKVEWVDAGQVATINPKVTQHKLEFARINGMLWLRGWFKTTTETIAAFEPILTITDSDYLVKNFDLATRCYNQVAATFSTSSTSVIRFTIDPPNIQYFSNAAIIQLNNERIIGSFCVGELVN